MVNTIWFRFDLIRFRKDFSVCNYCNPSKLIYFRIDFITRISSYPSQNIPVDMCQLFTGLFLIKRIKQLVINIIISNKIHCKNVRKKRISSHYLFLQWILLESYGQEPCTTYIMVREPCITYMMGTYKYMVMVVNI